MSKRKNNKRRHSDSDLEWYPELTFASTTFETQLPKWDALAKDWNQVSKKLRTEYHARSIKKIPAFTIRREKPDCYACRCTNKKCECEHTRIRENAGARERTGWAFTRKEFYDLLHEVRHVSMVDFASDDTNRDEALLDITPEAVAVLHTASEALAIKLFETMRTVDTKDLSRSIERDGFKFLTAVQKLCDQHLICTQDCVKHRFSAAKTANQFVCQTLKQEDILLPCLQPFILDYFDAPAQTIDVMTGFTESITDIFDSLQS